MSNCYENGVLDLGIRCAVCDRAHIIVDEEEGIMGCAYAIRGGLCQNKVILTEEELHRCNPFLDARDYPGNPAYLWVDFGKALREGKSIWNEKTASRRNSLTQPPTGE